MTRTVSSLCLLLLVTFLARTNLDAASLSTVVLKRVPHVKQKPDFCGEACAEMVLKRLGKPFDQDFVFDQSGLDPVLGRGCYTRELVVALKRIGFDVGKVWYQVQARDGKHLRIEFDKIHADLKRGIPTILCTRFDHSKNTTEHFRLIIGYSAKTDEVIYHDPALKSGSNMKMKLAQLFKLWPLKYQRDRWTLIRIPMKPARITQRRVTAGYTNADYAQHILKLKKRLPRGFHIHIEKPFVVVGDEPAKTVARRAKNTVKWSVDHIKKLYFEKDPQRILDVWLFKDKASYQKYTWEIFRDKPGTPFGYYSSDHRALIMNISTGGGTLVHEIVHPFIESNFPRCPAWFNEGLASLYEQSGSRKGRIWGFTNWRLAGLQKAISGGRVPQFKKLCSTSTNEFYNADPGTNYAQARYLCHFLQKQGKLQTFYREFSRGVNQDPSGYRTLQKVLGRTDMTKFKKDWEQYVLKLQF